MKRNIDFNDDRIRIFLIALLFNAFLRKNAINVQVAKKMNVSPKNIC